MVQLDFVEEADVDIEREYPTTAGTGEGTQAADGVPPLLEEDEEEDEELEEVGIFWLPLLLSMLNVSDCAVAYSSLAPFCRPLLGHEDGGSSESDDGSHREAELDGVD